MKKLTLLGMMFLIGCATTGTMRNAPLSEGVEKVYQHEYEKVLEASTTAVVEAGMGIQEISNPNDNTTVLICEKGMSMTCYGERVRIVVEKQSDTATAVRILTKKKLATNIFAEGNWSKRIFPLIDSKLK